MASSARESRRLFLALWPDADVRAQLEAACRELGLESGRAVVPHDLHVTLVFLGAVDAARFACLEQALASVTGARFDFILTGIEWRRRTGMVWLTAAEVPAELSALVGDLNAALAECGHAAERRPFRLHVTAARNVRRAPRRRALAPIHWRAGEFCLVSSVPTSHGSEYAVERRWSLG